MSEEMKKIDAEELEEVSGGKGHKTGRRDRIEDCPPGTIEVKNEQLKNTGGTKKHCPYCDTKHGLENHMFFMADTKMLVEGQVCTKCGKRWITHGYK